MRTLDDITYPFYLRYKYNKETFYDENIDIISQIIKGKYKVKIKLREAFSVSQQKPYYWFTISSLRAAKNICTSWTKSTALFYILCGLKLGYFEEFKNPVYYYYKENDITIF